MQYYSYPVSPDRSSVYVKLDTGWYILIMAKALLIKANFAADQLTRLLSFNRLQSYVPSKSEQEFVDSELIKLVLGVPC